jgi:tetratricopeptide (TPR) repeat protein
MSDSRRVPIHYFPKRPRSVPPAPITTEFTPIEVTEASPTVPISQEELWAATENAAQKEGASSVSGHAHRRVRKSSGSTKGGKKAGRRTRTPVAVSTDPAVRYHQGKVNALIADREKAPARSAPSKQLTELALHGHTLFEGGHLDEARAVFEQIVSLGVKDAFPHAMLGTIYLALGKHDRALALFEEALALDGNDIAARVYRGELRLNAGKIKPALADLFRALELGPPSDPFVERARRLIGIAQKMKHRRKR